MDNVKSVVIDGVSYVPVTEIQAQDQSVMLLLASLYSKVWPEAYYDPYNDATRAFALELMPEITELNKILKFKK